MLTLRISGRPLVLCRSPHIMLRMIPPAVFRVLFPTALVAFYLGEPTAPAAAEMLQVCHGYSCHYKTRLQLGARDMERMRSIMRSGAGSAKAERRAVGKLVQYYERRAAGAVGIKDRPKSDFGGGRERGQMDCIDESTNTTALLRLAAKRGWLKHHKVLRPASRGFLVDGRYPHSTAVLVDGSGEKWAVDSWYEPAGGPPDIMPLSRWSTRGVRGVR